MNESQESNTIAVLITCHNRRETTLRALQSLREQSLPDGCSLRILLTDDGSTDGTGDAVRSQFPEVTVLQGDGNLFWAGGTSLAWEAAGEADFYLWLNDDVVLFPHTLATLFHTYREAGQSSAIIVGATRDPVSNKTSTGGIRRRSWHNCFVMEPEDKAKPCDAFSGNIVLIPQQAKQELGYLDPAFRHFFADADYGMRAKQKGIVCLLAAGHLGACQLNPLTNSSFDTKLSFRQRWQKMFGAKGYRPPREWWAFVRAHAPRPKTLYWAIPYLLFVVEGAFGGKVRLRRNVKHPADVG